MPKGKHPWSHGLTIDDERLRNAILKGQKTNAIKYFGLCFEVVRLQLDGYKNTEIARMLDCSVRTVCYRAQRYGEILDDYRDELQGFYNIKEVRDEGSGVV